MSNHFQSHTSIRPCWLKISFSSPACIKNCCCTGLYVIISHFAWAYIGIVLQRDLMVLVVIENEQPLFCASPGVRGLPCCHSPCCCRAGSAMSKTRSPSCLFWLLSRASMTHTFAHSRLKRLPWRLQVRRPSYSGFFHWSTQCRRTI